MVNIVSHWLVNSEDYLNWKVESCAYFEYFILDMIMALAKTGE